jgi:hypothetical protein
MDVFYREICSPAAQECLWPPYTKVTEGSCGAQKMIWISLEEIASLSSPYQNFDAS